jgi:uncharacterized damage-inducible protein DinB
MYRRVDDFLDQYRNLAEGTDRILGALTDESLDQEVADGHRTIRRLAWHIVVTVPEMMNRTGLGLSSVDQHTPPPQTAHQIREAYGAVSSELVEAVAANWSDEGLLETDDMYGQSWTRGASAHALVLHEVHHRAQLTVLMRQAGLQVPGVFGPAKEEWAQYGMEAPPV